MPNLSRTNPGPITRLPERIRRKLSVLPGDCWEWTGYVDPKGRPLMSYHGILSSPRRVVYSFLTESILATSEPVSPTCGNRLCMNPMHMRIGNVANSTPSTTPRFGQARHICALFGGPIKMAALLGISPSSCYKWSYPRPKGCNGIVPARHIPKIKSLARFYGVLLSAADWAPREKE